MKKNRKQGRGIAFYFLVASTFLTALFAEPSQAQSSGHRGFYLGAHFGKSTFDSPDPTTVSGKINTTRSTRTWTESSSTDWSVDVGYNFSRYFAIEARYLDFGQAQFDETRVSTAQGQIGS